MAERNEIEQQALDTWNRLLRQYQLGMAFRLVLVIGIATILLLIINHFLPLSFWLFILILLLFLASTIWFRNLYAFSSTHLIASLNHQYRWMEFSAHLIPVVPSQIMQQLQRERILNNLSQRSREVKAWPDLKLLLITFGGVVILYVLGSFITFSENKTTDHNNNITTKVSKVPLVENEKLPEILSIKIEVKPPAYTQKAAWLSETPSFEAPEGSLINFNVDLTDTVDEFKVIWNGKDTLLADPSTGSNYKWKKNLKNSLYYQFQFIKNDNSYTSPVYTIHAIEDIPPLINIESPASYTFVLYGQEPQVRVKAKLTDDYGLKKAQLVATVSRGSGESVKFREERLEFSENVTGRRNVTLQKPLQFSELQMEPGDELYFYIEAWDHANPSQNNRSETYFVQWEDTTSNTLSVIDGIAIDNMPAYFRSQRQIIIDTERLIKDQYAITKEEFNQRSNDLGIDQKILRLRYGKFLGEEFETTIVRQAPATDSHDHDHDHEGDDHEHDSEKENKSGNTEQSHDHDHNHEGAASPIFGSNEGMEQYEHRHDIAEAATFFEEATKAQLKAALAQMWESELRLRTLRPKEALKFEYKALELIKAVQQKSRVYVEKVGFEPPPLNPGESRLTGKLDEVTDPERIWDANSVERAYPNLRYAVAVLEEIKLNPEKNLSRDQKRILEDANHEMAAIILQQPGLNVLMLNSIRGIIAEEKFSHNQISNLQKQIANLLPTESIGPGLETSRNEPEMEHLIKILRD